MKRGYLKTYLKMIFIILIITAIAVVAVHFLKTQYNVEQLETIKTNMLLIEGKTKIVNEKVKIKEKGSKYVGTKIKNMVEEPEIKELIDKEIVDIDGKKKNYYVLDKSNLEELGLDNIELENGYYIVEYNTNEIIYSKGILDDNGNILYKLSEFSK